MIRIAVFASGAGTNIKNIYNAIQERKFIKNCKISIIVTDRDNCGAVTLGKELGIPVHICKLSDFEDRRLWNMRLQEIVQTNFIDLICFAGFMKIVDESLIKPNRFSILNIHPGLLPGLPGKDPQRRALELELPGTGNTVHLVTENVDDSRFILAQDYVAITPGMTEEDLSEQLKEIGYQTYIKAINIWMSLVHLCPTGKEITQLLETHSNKIKANTGNISMKDENEKITPDSSTEDLKLLGSNSTTKFDKPSQDILETFPAPEKYSFEPGLEAVPTLVVEFEQEHNEFTSNCPKTGQPDFATFSIVYAPGKKCIESKSLKLYLQSFRNTAGFGESITQRIADDLNAVMKPKWIIVKGIFSPRGGIKWTTYATIVSDEMTDMDSLFAQLVTRK